MSLLILKLILKIEIDIYYRNPNPVIQALQIIIFVFLVRSYRYLTRFKFTSCVYHWVIGLDIMCIALIDLEFFLL